MQTDDKRKKTVLTTPSDIEAFFNLRKELRSLIDMREIKKITLIEATYDDLLRRVEPPKGWRLRFVRNEKSNESRIFLFDENKNMVGIVGQSIHPNLLWIWKIICRKFFEESIEEAIARVQYGTEIQVKIIVGQLEAKGSYENLIITIPPSGKTFAGVIEQGQLEADLRAKEIWNSYLHK